MAIDDWYEIKAIVQEERRYMQMIKVFFLAFLKAAAVGFLCALAAGVIMHYIYYLYSFKELLQIAAGVSLVFGGIEGMWAIATHL